MAEIDPACARQASGMTQEAVAAEMGKAQENVSRIERQRDVRVSTPGAVHPGPGLVSRRSIRSSPAARQPDEGNRGGSQGKPAARLLAVADPSAFSWRTG